MYTLGSDVPLILQGAAQREVLTPEQTQRVSTMIVERGGVPIASPAYSPSPSKGFFSSIAGDTPLWLLAGGGIVLAALITRR